MTSLRDAYPTSSPLPDHSPAPHALPDGIPHGAAGGASAGSMDNKLPIKQVSGHDSIESYLRQIQTENMPPQQPPQPPQPGSEDPAAMQAMQLKRQQMFQAQAAAAEARMRGIAQQENRLQAVGFVAMGMCLVFAAVFFLQMRGNLSFGAA
ncbi:hypothetical protein WJX74_003442 [Apatococcus lobatus]|uniref:Uncharacterized protein n=1 Tax=Apatococcus lobatus TaxID=904363 RepID=A0AAW1R0M4_9CHLO